MGVSGTDLSWSVRIFTFLCPIGITSILMPTVAIVLKVVNNMKATERLRQFLFSDG